MAATQNSAVQIPKLAEGRLASMAECIRPVMRGSDIRRGYDLDPSSEEARFDVRMLFRAARIGLEARPSSNLESELYYIKPAGLNSFFRNMPVPTEIAKDLIEVARVHTYHFMHDSPGTYTRFRPTVAQVLAQIPAEYVSWVAAFETVADTAANGSRIYSDDRMYQRAVTTLYRPSAMEEWE